ncbi:hypothetical protein PGB90_003487 [Kerria lacca]
MKKKKNTGQITSGRKKEKKKRRKDGLKKKKKGFSDYLKKKKSIKSSVDSAVASLKLNSVINEEIQIRLNVYKELFFFLFFFLFFIRIGRSRDAKNSPQAKRATMSGSIVRSSIDISHCRYMAYCSKKKEGSIYYIARLIVSPPNVINVAFEQEEIVNFKYNEEKFKNYFYYFKYLASCKLLTNIIIIRLLQRVHISLLDADPACFPIGGGDSSFTNLENIEATAVGWGATNEDLSVAKRSDLLRNKILYRLKPVTTYSIPILRNNDCQQWYRSQNKSLSLRKSQMCAGYKSGEKDTCWADSGGPLMIRNERIMIVVGIVSTGIGCARASLPGIYTRLSEYINWMKNTIS